MKTSSKNILVISENAAGEVHRSVKNEQAVLMEKKVEDQKEKKYVVYMLRDPRSFHPKYVGQTGNTSERYSNHIVPSQLRKKSLKNNWVKSLFGIGLKPVLVIIEECASETTCKKREIYWISYFRSKGYRLTNGTDGGDGTPGHRVSKAHKEKLKALYTGRRMGAEFSAKMSYVMRGNKNGTGNKARTGMEPANKIKLGPEIESKIVADYVSGNSPQRTLATEFMVSRHAIKRILEEHGVVCSTITPHYVKKSRPRKLTDSQISKIRSEYPEKSGYQLAAEYGVDPATIYTTIRRES